jgi:large subunit ribosomal protein L18
VAKEHRRVARIRRHARVRAKVHGTGDRPRLSVFRSLNNIYVQVIDDTIGHTLASASTLDPEIKAEMNGKNKTGRSELVGALVAKRALATGVTEVAFDRGGYKYHGRIKALAEAARKQGLKF